MKPQEVKPKAQTDWLGFRKGVRTYVQRASLMMPSPETATKATMSLHVTAEHMSSKFTMKPQEVKPKAQTDWLGFRKGVRTYVQRASLMMPSPETATKATMSLHVTAEHMSSKFTQKERTRHLRTSGSFLYSLASAFGRRSV